jgi:hypothetical protein
MSRGKCRKKDRKETWNSRIADNAGTADTIASRLPRRRLERTMATKPDPVAAIFRHYGIAGRWRQLR